MMAFALFAGPDTCEYQTMHLYKQRAALTHAGQSGRIVRDAFWKVIAGGGQGTRGGKLECDKDSARSCRNPDT